VKVKECLNIGAILKAPLALHLLEGLGKTVAPAALGQERIEHEKVFLVWPAAMLKAPFEDFLVRAAVESPFDDFEIFELKKSAYSSIRAGAVFVIGRQLVLGVQANFVEHPSEEDDAANLFRRVSKTRDFHMELRPADWQAMGKQKRGQAAVGTLKR
jgi:hypothetical protein